MKKDELRRELVEIRKNCVNLQWRLKSLKPLYNDILKHTHGFDKFKPEPIERVHAIINNITDRPKCYCGEYVKFNKRIYFNYCSKKCVQLSSEVIQKKKDTCIEKFGVEYSLQSIKLRQKSKETYLEKTGYENPSQNPNIKQKKIERSIENWGYDNPMHDPILFEKTMKARYKRKPFMFLSGKVIYVQGYEPQILQELIYHFDESDIITGAKNIPKIMYEMDDVKHRYFPDIYIKSKNLIIEVKSVYTFSKNKEKNQLKQQACKDAGYNFWFAVI